MRTFYKLLLVLLYLVLMLAEHNCVTFNRNLMGVSFTPYVANTSIRTNSEYSLSEVKTMLKVVSQKFSKISTNFVGAVYYEYKENVSYYQSSSAVYSAEAAALVNTESTSDINPLSIIVGISVSDEQAQMTSEMQLALESARKANLIYPGTCVGFTFFDEGIHSNILVANRTLSQLKAMKTEARKLNVKVGTKQICEGFDELRDSPVNLSPLNIIRREKLLLTEIIICKIHYNVFHTFRNTVHLDRLTSDLINYRNSIQYIKPDIEVMVEVGISSFGTTLQPLKYFLNLWIYMDNWAVQNNFTVFMDEAIDNPWKGGRFAHYGWWKLMETKEPWTASSYAEKVLEISTTFLPPINPTSEYKEDSDTESNTWIYATGIAGPIALIALVLLIVLIIQRVKIRKLRNILTQKEVQQFIEGKTGKIGTKKGNETGKIEDSMSSDVISKPYDRSIEISKENCRIDYSKMLGIGEFGCVYKAVILKPEEGNNLEVALKMTKDSCPKTALMCLLTEIKILIHLGEHPHLVSIIGAYTTEIAKGIVYVATELCALGSLKNFLRDAEKGNSTNTTYSNVVTFCDMIKWSYETACGMEYLARKHVVHADLATRNVLLTEDRSAKITDFGLSRRLYDYTNYVKKQQEPLPWRWLAIESLKSLEFSSQSDVWSYGVTLWEVFSMGNVPYPGLSWNLGFVSSLEAGMRMTIPTHATEEIFEVTSSCWEREPQNRPTFMDLKQTFGRILDTQYDYISNM